MSDQTRFLLNESDLPKFWYNVMADSPRRTNAGPSSGYARTGHAGFSIGSVPNGSDPAGSLKRTIH